MAVEGDACVGRVPACLCVLCGLPAAGKSSLARTILGTAAQHGWRATVVPYDDVIPEHAFQTVVMDGGMHTEWKLHRQAVLQCIEQFLIKPQMLADQPSSCQINRAAWEKCIHALLQPHPLEGFPADQTALLFLLDDNFYYTSMRYEVYQLARKYSLGFCQVNLQCDLKSCISRNQIRSQPVPTEVIVDMEKRLEFPNPQKNSWETNSISLNSTNCLSKCDIHKVVDLISFALSNPLSPVEDNAEQKEADRLKCAASVVHQADQACRRLISEAMKTAKENQVRPDHMRSLAAKLNELKSIFLDNLRKQFLQEGYLPVDEDIDVEGVVTKAVENFEQEKRQILNDHK